MNNLNKENENKIIKDTRGSDCSSKDNDADKTGTDKNSDSTQIIKIDKDTAGGKFDKPKRETDPDRTGIDTESDKTKKEK